MRKRFRIFQNKYTNFLLYFEYLFTKWDDSATELSMQLATAKKEKKLYSYDRNQSKPATNRIKTILNLGIHFQGLHFQSFRGCKIFIFITFWNDMKIPTDVWFSKHIYRKMVSHIKNSSMFPPSTDYHSIFSFIPRKSILKMSFYVVFFKSFVRLWNPDSAD